MDIELLRLVLLIEIKGNFYLENKGNSKRAVFNLMSERENNIYCLKKVLDEYDIKYCLFKRKYKQNKNELTLLRISYNRNLFKFFKLVNPFIQYKPNNYDLVHNYVLEKSLKK